MDTQQLSHLVDTVIDEMLAQRKRRLQSHNKVMRVVLSGEDLSTLPSTLECLIALERCGYLLVIAFSHSARRSLLQSHCLQALAEQGVEVICDNQPPSSAQSNYHDIFFPALSTNSLSKIALGIRDNLVCRWAFHALSVRKTAIITLNPECRPDRHSALPPALKARLMNYASTLTEYGFTVIGLPESTPGLRSRRSLITLSDVRQHPQGQPLKIDSRTLITPAAQDEIRDRHLVIVQPLQEDLCIWQR
ncbi:hypothetical protein [Kluyvera sp. CHPC 1.2972]|uniref:hypothetical protein n=1 Tax=Kluyvera sp. CHPC 1.2972 TaxID=2995176 RepID=UPI002FD85946